MRGEKRRGTGKREAVSAVRWKGVACSVGAGVGVSLGILCLCAWLIAAALLPEHALQLCSIVSAGSGAMVCAWLAGRWGRRGALWGMSFGVLLACVFAVTGLLLYSKIDPARCVLTGGVCALVGAVPGMVMGKKGKRRRL